MADSKLVEELEAMQDSEKWKAYKTKKMQTVADKLNVEECEKFAEYMNTKVLMAIKANGGDKMYVGWKDRPKDEKKQFVQQIVDTFIESVISDIWNDRVTIYKDDGSVYEKIHTGNSESDEHFDRIWKEDISKKPKIVVTDIHQGLMGVAPTGELVINFDVWLYNSLVGFLMDLRHELDHVVNMFFPNIHPLALNGRDRLTAMRYYVQPEIDAELYEKNPVEITANMKRGEFAEMCSMAVAGKPWNEPKKTVDKSDDLGR